MVPYVKGFMSPIESIGARLRSERDRLGLNQEQFAATAATAGARGSTRQSQSLYEKDERLPDVGYMRAIAGLGVDVRYVITGSRDYEPPPPLTAEEQTLLAYYREAAPAVRKAAMGALVGALPGRPAAAPRVLVTGQVGQQFHAPVSQPGLTINMGGKKRR